MQFLVDLVKIGAIGASLAFLYLSYNLLRSEISLKDAAGNPLPARNENLAAIRNFRWAALTFLVVGIAAEFMFSQGPSFISALQHNLFSNEMVRVRFTNWEYFPERKELAFGFEESRLRPSVFVEPAQTDKYQVYVGVRKKTEKTPAVGDYKLLFGPYSISNQPNIQKLLDQNDVELLGHRCIEFTAFGVEKNSSDKIGSPFIPEHIATKVFNSATACLPK